jgi:hypothetical protein
MSDENCHDECYSKRELDAAVEDYKRFLLRVRNGFQAWAEANGHPWGHCKCSWCKPWLGFDELFPKLDE